MIVKLIKKWINIINFKIINNLIIIKFKGINKKVCTKKQKQKLKNNKCI